MESSDIAQKRRPDHEQTTDSASSDIAASSFRSAAFMMASRGTEKLAILNPEPTRQAGPCFLHDLVRKESPKSQPAITSLEANGSGASISYSQLHELAEALAGRITAALHDHHDQSAPIVPLLIPQTPLLYIAELGILKAGGAFCPLNLDIPQERLNFVLNDVSARVVLTTRQYASTFPDGADLTVIVVDESKEQQEKACVNHHRFPIQPESLAYVMYTSGSTGTPKGVGISHLAATQSLLAHDKHIPEFQRFLQFAAPTFDVSVFEIFFPLTRGSTLVTCSRAEMLNDLPGVINSLDVDACELTPTVAGSLLRSRDRAPSLRLLLTIGEMLTEPVIREFGGSEGVPSMLWAMYGPTEAAIHWHVLLSPEVL